jgi:hypothetical protein
MTPIDDPIMRRDPSDIAGPALVTDLIRGIDGDDPARRRSPAPSSPLDRAGLAVDARRVDRAGGSRLALIARSHL